MEEFFKSIFLSSKTPFYLVLLQLVLFVFLFFVKSDNFIKFLIELLHFRIAFFIKKMQVPLNYLINKKLKLVFYEKHYLIWCFLIFYISLIIIIISKNKIDSEELLFYLLLVVVFFIFFWEMVFDTNLPLRIPFLSFTLLLANILICIILFVDNYDYLVLLNIEHEYFNSNSSSFHDNFGEFDNKIKKTKIIKTNQDTSSLVKDGFDLIINISFPDSLRNIGYYNGLVLVQNKKLIADAQLSSLNLERIEFGNKATSFNWNRDKQFIKNIYNEIIEYNNFSYDDKDIESRKECLTCIERWHERLLDNKKYENPNNVKVLFLRPVDVDKKKDKKTNERLNLLGGQISSIISDNRNSILDKEIVGKRKIDWEYLGSDKIVDNKSFSSIDDYRDNEESYNADMLIYCEIGYKTANLIFDILNKEYRTFLADNNGYENEINVPHFKESPKDTISLFVKNGLKRSAEMIMIIKDVKELVNYFQEELQKDGNTIDINLLLDNKFITVLNKVNAIDSTFCDDIFKMQFKIFLRFLYCTYLRDCIYSFQSLLNEMNLYQDLNIIYNTHIDSAKNIFFRNKDIFVSNDILQKIIEGYLYSLKGEYDNAYESYSYVLKHGDDYDNSVSLIMIQFLQVNVVGKMNENCEKIEEIIVDANLKDDPVYFEFLCNKYKLLRDCYQLKK